MIPEPLSDLSKYVTYINILLILIYGHFNNINVYILFNLYIESKHSLNFLLNWLSDTAYLTCWGSVFQNIGPV